MILLVLVHELFGDEVAAAEHHCFSDETHCDSGVGGGWVCVVEERSIG